MNKRSQNLIFSAHLFLARMRDPRTPQSTRTSPFPDSVRESLLQCGITFSDVSFNVATKLDIAEERETYGASKNRGFKEKKTGTAIWA